MKTLILIAMLLILPAITFAQEIIAIQGINDRAALIIPAPHLETVIAPEKPKEKFQSEYSAVYGERQIVTISGINDQTEKMLVWIMIGAMCYTLDGSIPELTDGVIYLGIHQMITLSREEGLKFIGIASMNGTKFHCLQFRK